MRSCLGRKLQRVFLDHRANLGHRAEGQRLRGSWAVPDGQPWIDARFMIIGTAGTCTGSIAQDGNRPGADGLVGACRISLAARQGSDRPAARTDPDPFAAAAPPEPRQAATGRGGCTETCRRGGKGAQPAQVICR